MVQSFHPPGIFSHHQMFYPAYVEIQGNKKESISQNFICQINEFYALNINKEIGDHNPKIKNLSGMTTERLYFFFIFFSTNRKTRESQLKNQIIKSINIAICILPITPMKITKNDTSFGVHVSAVDEKKGNRRSSPLLGCEMRNTKISPFTRWELFSEIKKTKTKTKNQTRWGRREGLLSVLYQLNFLTTHQIIKLIHGISPSFFF